MKALFKFTDGLVKEICQIDFFEITRTLFVACDSIYIKFASENFLPEAETIEIIFNDKTVFKGYIDKQTCQKDENGLICTVYARSMAAILVDNEVEPQILYCPSSHSLFKFTAEKFAFKNCLPELYTNKSFELKKGMSYYSAIHDFVCLCGKQGILIDNDKNIMLAESKNEKELDNSEILSIKTIVNRAVPITQIDYKSENSTEYNNHFKSLSVEKSNIYRTRKMSLSNMPEWQKTEKAKQTIKKSLMQYKETEIVLQNSINKFELFDKIRLKTDDISNDEIYIVKEIRTTFSEKGTFVTLLLYKETEMEAINYVD